MASYAITEQDGRVVLPATHSDETLAEVTSWNEAADNLDRFLERTNAGVHSGRAVRTAAVLVHHAANTYNPNAISVSEPSASQAPGPRRHLGYLYDSFLRKVGFTNLPDLITFAGGEVVCTVVTAGAGHLAVDVPEPAVLAEAIRVFLASRGVRAAGAPRFDNHPRRLHTHTAAHEATEKTPRLLGRFAAPAVRIEGLRLTTVRGGRTGRALWVFDSHTSRAIGTLDGRWLQLEDERDRERTLYLLGSLDILVDPPVAAGKLAEDGTWPRTLPPNVRLFVRAGGLDLRLHDPEAPKSQKSFAVYNPTLNVVWVEDSRLVAPALRVLHRQGFDVAEVGLPRKPWQLDDEVPYRALRDPNRPWAVAWATAPTVRLLPEVQSLIAPGILTPDVVAWALAPADSPPPEESFDVLEAHVQQRTTLFPVHELTGERRRCRLCGLWAAGFTTPIASEALAYCYTCLTNALNGLFDDRARAAIAVRQIGQLEFDGQPMLASQLDTLHVNPKAPLGGSDVDRLLLLRFAVARKDVAWTLLLEAAGLAEFGLRTSRGTLIRARDGHLCLSLRERAVCDFLHQHGIDHDREPLYPRDPDYNPSGLRRADWKLNDGTFVEFWGFTTNPQYAAKMVEKRQLAQRHGLRLIEIDDRDLTNLSKAFRQWLPAGSVSSWSWSPLEPARPIPSSQSANEQPKNEGRGHNEFNTRARFERVSRCATAVSLQQQGLTRTAIASQLGTTPEAVKAFLRDGKFYADPASDVARAARAAEASNAQDLGHTRDEFKMRSGLTQPKTTEAWRDAAVLRDKDSSSTPFQ